MQNTSSRNRTYWLAVMTVAIMGVFVLRLFYLQVIRHDYYSTLASAEQMKQWVLPAERGEIYAMNGDEPVKLVLNETIYTVWADPKVVEEPGKVISTLKRVAGGNVLDDFEKLLDKKDTRYQVLAKGISSQQAQMIKKEKIYGIGFERGDRRVYPEGQLAAQTLGFVNSEGEGRYGVEAGLNDRLTGKDGLLNTVVDVRDVPLTIGKDNVSISAKNGEDLVLTIDRNIQAYAEKALAKGIEKTGAKQASALIMDPRSGKVLAMANIPTYDPSKLDNVRDVAAFNNNTVSNPYEPGSDIKAFTVAIGIDRGVITPQSTYNNTDYIKVDDRTISNAVKGETGIIDMQHALNLSLNTGMVTIAQRLGNGSYITKEARNVMYEYLHNRLGLGELTGIEVANEASGTVISPDGVQGNAVRYSNMAFGQGMDVTMIQVTSAFSALVNGGSYYHPTVVAGTMNEDEFVAAPERDPSRSVIKPSTSSDVSEMVHQARNYMFSDADSPGYYIGGKTGTSQTLRDGKYVNNETIGTYLGFGGEKDQPTSYVIMIEVSGEGMNLEGGKHALPIFTDISNWMLQYLKLQPKG